MNNNETLKDALTTGISGDAVSTTLDSMVNKSSELGRTPFQVAEAVETIVDMKSDIPSNNNDQYASNLVRNNSERIKSALNDGISSSEIADTLIKQSGTQTNSRKLNFIVKLVQKIKEKEYRLSKKNDKEYQKQLTNK